MLSAKAMSDPMRGRGRSRGRAGRHAQGGSRQPCSQRPLISVPDVILFLFCHVSARILPAGFNHHKYWRPIVSRLKASSHPGLADIGFQEKGSDLCSAVLYVSYGPCLGDSDALGRMRHSLSEGNKMASSSIIARGVLPAYNNAT